MKWTENHNEAQYRRILKGVLVEQGGLEKWDAKRAVENKKVVIQNYVSTSEELEQYLKETGSDSRFFFAEYYGCFVEVMN